MSYLRRHFKLVALATTCAALGAGASAIASAGAANGPTTATAHPAGAKARRVWLARAVHGNLSVATRSGFVTVTFDRGLVQSVQGQQLTLVEGDRTTHKTVTLTVPANTIVRENGKAATLAEVKPGQRALVVQGPNHVRVFAHTPRTP